MRSVSEYGESDACQAVLALAGVADSSRLTVLEVPYSCT